MHESEIERAQKKLQNEKFVERAPAHIVAAEREKVHANQVKANELRSLLLVLDQ